MDFAYPAHLERELDGRYTVTFPGLPDAITQGEDRDDALAMAADCLAETIGARIVDRADIPAPSPPEPEQVRVVVPVHVAVKGALYVAMKEEGMSMSDLARVLKGQHLQVRRLLDPGRASSMKRIDQALSALGRHVCVSLDSRDRRGGTRQ
ncbi:MAG: type II toxin-antitoxin system HicB family antitoxin [Acidobacteria bacterium]|nr:type II toxin-antitoxin system HicB family antitoxin [Acidobacteriota bacterium]